MVSTQLVSTHLSPLISAQEASILSLDVFSVPPGKPSFYLPDRPHNPWVPWQTGRPSIRCSSRTFLQSMVPSNNVDNWPSFIEIRLTSQPKGREWKPSTYRCAPQFNPERKQRSLGQSGHDQHHGAPIGTRITFRLRFKKEIRND